MVLPKQIVWGFRNSHLLYLQEKQTEKHGDTHITPFLRGQAGVTRRVWFPSHNIPSSRGIKSEVKLGFVLQGATGWIFIRTSAKIKVNGHPKGIKSRQNTLCCSNRVADSAKVEFSYLFSCFPTGFCREKNQPTKNIEYHDVKIVKIGPVC